MDNELMNAVTGVDKEAATNVLKDLDFLKYLFTLDSDADKALKTTMEYLRKIQNA